MEKRVLVYEKNKEHLRNVDFLLRGEQMSLDIEDDHDKMIEKLGQEEFITFLIPMNQTDSSDALLEEMLLIKEIRSLTEKPVLAIGYELDEMTKISMLNVGVDDCIDLSCTPLEMLARIKAHIRRYNQLSGNAKKTSNVVKIGELEIDDGSKTVQVEGKSVSMTPMEYKILYLLAQKRGCVLSTKQIYESIWKMKAIGADNTIAVHVRHIREKIERNPQEPKYLQLVWGQGYKVG